MDWSKNVAGKLNRASSPTERGRGERTEPLSSSLRLQGAQSDKALRAIADMRERHLGNENTVICHALRSECAMASHRQSGPKGTQRPPAWVSSTSPTSHPASLEGHRSGQPEGEGGGNRTGPRIASSSVLQVSK
jgi:hypothetical protein